MKRETETERPTLAGKSAAIPAQAQACTARGRPSRKVLAVKLASNPRGQAPACWCVPWRGKAIGAGIASEVGAFNSAGCKQVSMPRADPPCCAELFRCKRWG